MVLTFKLIKLTYLFLKKKKYWYACHVRVGAGKYIIRYELGGVMNYELSFLNSYASPMTGS